MVPMGRCLFTPRFSTGRIGAKAAGGGRPGFPFSLRKRWPRNENSCNMALFELERPAFEVPPLFSINGVDDMSFWNRFKKPTLMSLSRTCG